MIIKKLPQAESEKIRHRKVEDMHNGRSNLFQVHEQWLCCNAIHPADSVMTG